MAASFVAAQVRTVIMCISFYNYKEILSDASESYHPFQASFPAHHRGLL